MRGPDGELRGLSAVRHSLKDAASTKPGRKRREDLQSQQRGLVVPAAVVGRRLHWGLFLAAGAVFFALAVWCSVYAERVPLPIALWLNVVVLVGTGIFMLVRDVHTPLPTLPWGARLIFLGFTLLYVMLAYRLLSESHFAGAAANFDFGRQCEDVEDDECNKPNLSFTPTFNSFGHALQGFMSVLLWPVPAGLVVRLSDRTARQANYLGCVQVPPPPPRPSRASPALARTPRGAPAGVRLRHGGVPVLQRGQAAVQALRHLRHLLLL
jgi:hypothetical protein